MSETDTTSPTPLPDRALCLLERIREEGGEWTTSYAAIADACGLARSTAQLAVRDLIEAGLIEQGASRPRHGTLYRLVPTTRTDAVPTRTDVTVPTRTDPLSLDAPAREPAPATRPPGWSPPTPYVPSAATGSETASRDARGELVPTQLVPTDARPIGSLAVAAAMEAARAVDRSIDPPTRARIGHAAQALAKDESVETILAAARRLGEGGFSDLYTAVRAVDRGAPSSPAPAAPLPTGSRLAETIRFLRATWPRIVVDVDVWDRELAKIPERYLLAGVRELARSGAEFPPTWGQVYRASYRIGVAETERRRSAEERASIRERVRAIEES